MKCSLKFSNPVYNLFLFILMCVFITLCSTNALANGDYTVICNASNPAASISDVNLMNIFLGKKTSWDNGKKITFVTLKEGDSHKQFLRKQVKKNPQQFKNYWKKMLFTGKGVIPKSFSDDAGVVEFVKNNEGAIGYISKETSADGIKILPISN